MAFDLGDLVPLTVTVKDAAGVATNASTVVLTVTLPDGTTVAPSVANPPAVTGVYVCDYATTVAGRHSARWVSTGPSAAYLDAFDVRPADAPYIVSLRDAKAHLKITDTSTDEELRGFIEDATGVVERHLNKAVVRRSFTEEQCASCGFFTIDKIPALSLTTVASVDGTKTWDVSKLHVDPAGIVTASSGTALAGPIAVTYIAGMPLIPSHYTRAAKIIIQHLWETQRPSGGTLRPNLPDSMGTVNRSGMGFAIPNRALELLGAGGTGIA